MKSLQRQKGLLRRSVYIGLSITMLSLGYTSSCMAEPEVLVRASENQKSLNIVHAESNVDAINEKQKSINVEECCVQKKQLLTLNEINSLEIKEKDNCRLLQLRAGGGIGNMIMLILLTGVYVAVYVAAANVAAENL